MFLSLTLSFSRSQTHTQTLAWPFPWSQLTFTQRRLWFFFRFLLPLSKIAFSIPIFSPLALIHPTLFCPPSSPLFNHLRSYFDFTCLLSSSPSPTASHYLPNPPLCLHLFGSFTPLSIYPQSYISLLHTSKPVFTLYRIFQNAENLRFPHLHRSLPFLPSLSLTPTKGCPCTIPSLPSSIPQSLFSVCSRPVLTKSVSSQVSLLSILTSGLQNRDKHAHWDSCVLKHTDACIYKHAPESTHGSL